MLKAKINKNLFKETINSIIQIIDEGKLRLNKDGLKLRAVDPANIAMIDLHLYESAFEDFQLNKELKDDIIIGVNFKRIFNIIKSNNKGDVILKLDEKSEILKLNLDKLEYSLHLFDPNIIRREPNIPELHHSAQLTMQISDLKKTIKMAEKIGESVILGISDEEEFYMITEGDEGDKLRLSLKKDQLINLIPANVHSTYSLNYMIALIRGMNITDTITLNLGDDYPLRADFNIEKNNGRISYLLAPRVS